MSATIRQIVDEALTVVGEVSGPGVQVYENDRMKQDAIRAFNMVFKKFYWHQYLQWFTVTLDGTTGKITTDSFEQVKDFEDFVAVHRDGEPGRIPIAPTKMNPSALGTSGPNLNARVMYWTSLNATDPLYEKRKLLFYPLTSAGKLNILARVYPASPPQFNLDWTDVLFLDKDMLTYATAFMTLSGDDLNAGAADVVRNLMEMRFKDVTAQLANHPIPVRGDSSIPFYWHER